MGKGHEARRGLLGGAILGGLMSLAGCANPDQSSAVAATGGDSASSSTSSSVTSGADSASATSGAATGITVIVLDSINGSAIAGATILVLDSSGGKAGSFTTGSGGMVDVSAAMTQGSTYAIEASASGRASSTLLNSKASSNSTIALYCPTIAMSNVSATIPKLVGIWYRPSGATTWTAWDPLASTVSLSAGFEIKASVAGVVAIEPSSWSGFGIEMAIDRMASLESGTAPTSYEVKSQLDNRGDAFNGMFISTAIFELSTAAFTSGSHSLDLVAYDVANDRLEIGLPFSWSSGSTSGTLSATFSGPTVELQSYGRSLQTFSLPSIQSSRALSLSSSPSSYEALLSFALSPPTAILGFEVWRSTDGQSFAKIAAVNYGSPTALSSTMPYYTYSDVDPTLSLGTSYYYKVKAFTSSSISNFSPVAKASFIAPFTDSLVSPADGSALASASPLVLAFSISDSSIWSGATAAASATTGDYFYFSLLLRSKSGAQVFYGEYRYNFGNGSFEAPARYSSRGVANWVYGAKVVPGISYSAPTITIDTSKACTSSYADTAVSGGLSLASGVAYEWDIFGDWWGSSYAAVGLSTSMDSAHFTQSNGQNGSAYSYANSYMGGEATLNGAFEFNWQ